MIHTKALRENKVLASDVSIAKLAEMTKNYTGAEIEAVCRSAKSFALFDENFIKTLEQESKKQKKVEVN